MKKTSAKNTKTDSDRLREIVQELGLPLRRLPEIMEANPEACLSWWSEINNNIKVSEAHFERIASFVGIDESKLFNGDYDRNLARKRLHGDYLALPERYSHNKNSFVRTSSHIMRYVVLTRGQWFADQILTGMSVSPMIYHSADAMINLTYFADLLTSLHHNGFSQKELDTLASVIFLSLQETELGRKFQNADSPTDIYKTLAENFNYFDSNFEYKSTFNHKKYTLATTLPLSEHPNLDKDSQSFQLLLRYRHILLAWFPFLAGLTPRFPHAEVVSTGDVLTVHYECDLSPVPTSKPRPDLKSL